MFRFSKYFSEKLKFSDEKVNVSCTKSTNPGKETIIREISQQNQYNKQ